MNRLQTLSTYLSRSFSNTNTNAVVPRIQSLTGYLTGREHQRVDAARTTQDITQQRQWAWEREREWREQEYMQHAERVVEREAYRGMHEEGPWDSSEGEQ